MITPSIAALAGRVLATGTQSYSVRDTRLYALGPRSAATADAFGAGARHFDSHQALADALKAGIYS